MDFREIPDRGNRSRKAPFTKRVRCRGGGADIAEHGVAACARIVAVHSLCLCEFLHCGIHGILQRPYLRVDGTGWRGEIETCVLDSQLASQKPDAQGIGQCLGVFALVGAGDGRSQRAADEACVRLADGCSDDRRIEPPGEFQKKRSIRFHQRPDDRSDGFPEVGCRLMEVNVSMLGSNELPWRPFLPDGESGPGDRDGKSWEQFPDTQEAGLLSLDVGVSENMIDGFPVNPFLVDSECCGERDIGSDESTLMSDRIDAWEPAGRIAHDT